MLDDLILEIKQNIVDYLINDNCMSVFTAAKLINDTETQERSLRFVITHFEEIVRHHLSAIVELPYEIFIEFLQNKSLNVKDEMSVWTAIVEWVQNDIPERNFHVPHLIRYLAWGDLNEDLAEEVLINSIIVDNPFCSDKITNHCSNQPNLLRNYLKCESDYFTDVHGFRIPRRLHIIAEFWPRIDDIDEIDDSQLYVTYDEKSDLWRTLVEGNFQPSYLISIKHNIYIFGWMVNRCIRFDLKEMNFVPISNFSGNYYYFRALNLDVFVFLEVLMMMVWKSSKSNTMILILTCGQMGIFRLA